LQNFSWTSSNLETQKANLYYVQAAKRATSLCQDFSWSAISAGLLNSTADLQFKLPALNQPARLEAGTVAAPCSYSWSPSHAMYLRKAVGTTVTSDALDDALDANALTDGRFVLKRHFARLSGTDDLRSSFLHTIPFFFDSSDAPLDEESFHTRDEIMWFTANGGNVLDLINSATETIGGITIPSSLDLFPSNSTTSLPEFGPFFSIAEADRVLLNSMYSNRFVGAFNNPLEIRAGALSYTPLTFDLVR
jgi:hypothetical protein